MCCSILVCLNLFSGPVIRNPTPSPVQVPLPKKFVDAADGDADQPAVKPVEESGEDGVRPVGLDQGSTKPHRWLQNNLAKQSGVPNVKWNNWAWQVGFPTFDKKGKKTGRTNRQFSLSRFMKEGFSEAVADAAALDAAMLFRAELVKRGILREAKPVDPNFTSEVPGVSWHKQKKKWRVVLNPTGKKRIYGGSFTEKSAAEAKALELAKEHGLERKVKAVGKLSELPIFKPKVPYPGITWRQAERQWRATYRVNGVQRNFRVKPMDHSEVEREASFQKAVAWKKKQEKEKKRSPRQSMAASLKSTKQDFDLSNCVEP